MIKRKSAVISFGQGAKSDPRNAELANRYTKYRGQNVGFTLIELMVVLLIVGILGTVAVPTYRQYVIRAHRTEAKTALLRLAANQERHYLQHNTYTDDLAALGFGTSVSKNGIYTLSVPLADAITYQAVAVPTPGGGPNGVDMSQDQACARFTVDAARQRLAFPDPDGTCW